MPNATLLGNNEILLNEATIIAAVQMLLEATHKEGSAPKVASVRWDGDQSGRRDGAFRCTLTEKKSEGAK